MGAPIKVSQVNQYIKRILNTDPVLGNISVTGEAADLRGANANGHIYFTIKDDKSTLKCFLPSWVSGDLIGDFNNGSEIVVNGYIDVYVPGGNYSLQVRSIDTKGSGDLSEKFEKLKRKLFEEGLFDSALKKPLPKFPRRVAVITSGTGAAVEDIKKQITDKNNITDIVIFPVQVQGEGAAEQIASALTEANKFSDSIDVIILGRGGGSAEDLGAFNEEITVRAVGSSDIPVITGIGHEIDMTLADLAADVSEKTPTAAAARAVPDIKEIKNALSETKEFMTSSLTRSILIREKMLSYMNVPSMLRRLSDRTEMYDIRSRAVMDKMNSGISIIVSSSENRASELVNSLSGIERVISDRENRSKLLLGRLNELDPRSILGRGYAALLDESGRMISGIDSINKGDRIRFILSGGEAEATVDKIRRKSNV